MLLKTSKELEEGIEVGDLSFMLSFIGKLKELNKEKEKENNIIKQAQCFQ